MITLRTFEAPGGYPGLQRTTFAETMRFEAKPSVLTLQRSAEPRHSALLRQGVAYKITTTGRSYATAPDHPRAGGSGGVSVCGSQQAPAAGLVICAKTGRSQVSGVIGHD